jgi:hypothetical protein
VRWRELTCEDEIRGDPSGRFDLAARRSSGLTTSEGRIPDDVEVGRNFSVEESVPHEDAYRNVHGKRGQGQHGAQQQEGEVLLEGLQGGLEDLHCEVEAAAVLAHHHELDERHERERDEDDDAALSRHGHAQESGLRARRLRAQTNGRENNCNSDGDCKHESKHSQDNLPRVTMQEPYHD